MRQPADDRALYLRQLRATVATIFLPELTSATAVDAAGLVDRILVEYIVEDEWAETLSQEFGAEFEALLVPGTDAHDDHRHAGAVRRATPPSRRAGVGAGSQRACLRTGSCADASSMWSAASWSGWTSSGAPSSTSHWSQTAPAR